MIAEDAIDVKSGVDLFIAPLGEPAFEYCALLARELRQQGAVIEVAANGKLKRSMELANKLGARFALIVGDEEMTDGRYGLKDMNSGVQEPVTREDLLQRFAAHS